MALAVVDASTAIEAMAGSSRRSASARSLLAQYSQWTVPHHFDLECLNGWRAMARRGDVPRAFVQAAVRELADAPIDRWATHPFHDRIAELDANVTPFDAAYVVLAEVLEVPLLTADARLARAPGTRCEFIVC